MYDTLKLLHILSSVIMVGTGFGSAFYMFMTNRSRNLQAQYVVSKLLVKATRVCQVASLQGGRVQCRLEVEKLWPG